MLLRNPKGRITERLIIGHRDRRTASLEKREILDIRKIIPIFTIISLFLVSGFARSPLIISSAVLPPAAYTCDSGNSGSGSYNLCVYSSGSDSAVILVAQASSQNIAACEKTGVSCTVFSTEANELQTHHATSGCDAACYGGAIHKSYEYTIVDTTKSLTLTTGTYLGSHTYCLVLLVVAHAAHNHALLTTFTGMLQLH